MNVAWMHGNHAGETPGNGAPPMAGDAPAAWCRYHAAVANGISTRKMVAQQQSADNAALITAQVSEAQGMNEAGTAAAPPRGDLYLLGATIATFGRFR